MAIGSLEQKLAVNPFGKIIEVDKRPEAIQEVKVNCDWAEEIIKNYIELDNENKDDVNDIIKSMGEVKLSPAQIDILYAFLSNENLLLKNSQDETTGQFFTKIMQDSFALGNNNFSLSNVIDAGSLGYKLQGTENNPIILSINGSVSYFCGQDAQYAKINLNGYSTGLLGFQSKKSEYNIYADVGERTGHSAEMSQFNIYGNAGVLLGHHSKNCIFSVYGRIGDRPGIDSSKCIYRTTIEATFEKLQQLIPSNNQIQLLDAHGNVIQEMEK